MTYFIRISSAAAKEAYEVTGRSHSVVLKCRSNIEWREKILVYLSHGLNSMHRATLSPYSRGLHKLPSLPRLQTLVKSERLVGKSPSTSHNLSRLTCIAALITRSSPLSRVWGLAVGELYTYTILLFCTVLSW